MFFLVNAKLKLKQSFHSHAECSKPLWQHPGIGEGRSFSSICMNYEGKMLYVPPVSEGWTACTALYNPTLVHRCNIESRWHKPCVLVGFLGSAWVLEPVVLCHMKGSGTCIVRTQNEVKMGRLWRLRLDLDRAQMGQEALVGLMCGKRQGPVAYKLPKDGARSGRAAAVGAVPNPFVCGVLLTALIPIQSPLSSLLNLFGAGFLPSTNKLREIMKQKQPCKIN